MISKDTIKWGLHIKPDDVYRFHNVIRDKFAYLYVDVSGLKPDSRLEFFHRFSGTYELIIKSPKNVNYANHKEITFSESLHNILSTLQESNNRIHGYVLALDGFNGVNAKQADNTVSNILLSRLEPVFNRVGVNLFMINNAYTVVNKFSISYILRIIRNRKHVKHLRGALDMEHAFFSGAKIMTALDAVDTLSDDFNMLVLSGVGVREGARPDILNCKVFMPRLYISLIKKFSDSIIVLDGNSVPDILNTRNFILDNWE